jgi:hypothetical protein
VTTDLELAPTRQVALLPSESETQRLHRAAVMLAGTEFVPASLRGKPEAIMAAMLTGREMGIHPMRSLRQIAIVDGRPAPSPELMMGLALKAGHYVRVLETDHDHCTVAVRRADWPEQDPPSTLTWTLEDAVRAGLCTLDDEGRPRARSRSGNPLPWETYTRAMLRSRAVTEACRAWLPDVVEGYSYAPEELGATVDGRGVPTDLADIGEGDPYAAVPADIRAEVAEAIEPDQDDNPEEATPTEQVDADPETGEITRDQEPAAEPEVWDVEAEPDPPATPAEPADEAGPFDWKAYADQRGVKTVPILTALRKDWPDNSQWNKPNRSADIDTLCADADMASYVRATIDDLAGVR